MIKKLGMLCLLIILVFTSFIAYQFWNTSRNYQALEFNEVLLDEIADGQYMGECNLGLVAVEVKVSVQNHVIENIELLHYAHGKGEEAVDILLEMQKANRTDVDSISNATISSAAMRKAVENALLQHEKNDA